MRSGSSWNVLRREDVDSARADVGRAAEGVDDLAGGQGPGDHVHAKIPAREVVLEGDVRTALDLEVAVTRTDGALASRQRDVDGLAAGGQFENGERRSDPVDAAEPFQPPDEVGERDSGDDVIGVSHRGGAGPGCPNLVANPAAHGVQ